MTAKADTWMPLYISDYLRKTMHLTRDQHGAYLLLIMACWDRGGRLPNDPGQLAGISRSTPAEWKRLAPVLLPFFETEGDWLLHERVAEERAKAQRLSDARREAGKQGGRPKNESKPKAIGLQTGSQNETPAQVALPSPSPPPIGGLEDADASLSDRADPPPPTKRFQPSKAELDGIWEITPRLGRERSGRKDLERSLTAAMRRGHDPEAIRQALLAAYASGSFSGDHAKGVHRLIENDRWQSFTELIEASNVVPLDRDALEARQRAIAEWAEQQAKGAANV